MLPFLGALVLVAWWNFLLFHLLVEFFAVIIAMFMFIIAWNMRRYIEHGYLLLLGIGYLFIGLLDFIHTLTYSGMGIFPGFDANPATQLWIVSRYFEAGTFFLVPFIMQRNIHYRIIFGVYLGFFLGFSLWIFSGKFPACFVNPGGLTVFKKVSEYLICVVLVVTLVLLIYKRKHFFPLMFRLIIASIALTIMSELFFTFYISVFGLSNKMGHLCKFLSFFLIYEGIVVEALKRPQQILYRNLHNQKEKLATALQNIKTLKGLLPICASCKKIRDDTGYWTQVEKYIGEHSDAVFTHGLCPECMMKFINEDGESSLTR